MELIDCVEFSFLWKSFSLQDNATFDDNHITNTFEDDNYLQLSDSVRVTVIDDDHQIINIEDSLMKANAVAIDVEWRPFSSGSLANKCSLLQIAVDNGINIHHN